MELGYVYMTKQLLTTSQLDKTNGGTDQVKFISKSISRKTSVTKSFTDILGLAAREPLLG